MKTTQVIAVLALAVVAVSGRATVKTAGDTSRPAPWYDCTGKQPGNYIHPYDCTRFITCDAGLQAIEFDCGDCSNRPDACTSVNRLVYNATVDQFLWTHETECFGIGTEAPVDPEPTTPENEPEQPLQEGDPCEPEECKNIRECQSYLRCNKESGRWVREECGDGMFWNPESGAVHGGNSDLLENLSDEIEERYRKAPQCLACFWEATGECEQEYRYQAPHLNNRNVLTLSCSAGLVFSQEKETCQRCSDVSKGDGTKCC